MGGSTPPFLRSFVPSKSQGAQRLWFVATWAQRSRSAAAGGFRSTASCLPPDSGTASRPPPMKENKTRERRRAPSAESSFSPRNYAEIHRGSFEFDGVKVIIAENTGGGAPSILALTRYVVHLTSMHMAVEGFNRSRKRRASRKNCTAQIDLTSREWEFCCGKEKRDSTGNYSRFLFRKGKTEEVAVRARWPCQFGSCCCGRYRSFKRVPGRQIENAEEAERARGESRESVCFKDPISFHR